MKHGRDAVGDRLPVAVRERDVDRKSTPGRGIICRSKASPWMSTMPGRHMRSRASMHADVPQSAPISSMTPSSRERGFQQLSADQILAALDANVH